MQATANARRSMHRSAKLACYSARGKWRDSPGSRDAVNTNRNSCAKRLIRSGEAHRGGLFGPLMTNTKLSGHPFGPVHEKLDGAEEF